jgi:two-component system chemotaxis sensor kinase CheA
MAAEDSDRQLMALFLNEVQERTRELERNLLAVETATDHPARRELLKALLRIAHSLKGAAGFVEVRPIETACHWMEELLSEARSGRLSLEAPQIGMLMEAIDATAEYGRTLNDGQEELRASAEERLREMGERISAAMRIPSEPEETVSTGGSPRSQRKLGTGEDQERSSAAPQTAMGTARATTTELDGLVQVSAEKLDSLLFRSGEILVSRSRSRSRVDQAADLLESIRHSRRKFGLPEAASRIQREDPVLDVESGLRRLLEDLSDDSRFLERAAASLNDEVHRARMQPFEQACQGLDRVVRDVGAGQNKSAELTIEGGDIEIDRSILGGLRDALRHLVRNAVDHGLETSANRTASGKPATGRIAIAASLRGDQVQVRVEDDGSGIDVISLRQQMADNANDEQSEGELLRRIFLPGVSTASAVTRLSGRGMGLDIVKDAVEKLRGSIDVTHAAGKGTAFILTLPLTVTTVRALLIVAGGQTFALDTASLVRLVRLPREELRSVSGRSVVPFGSQTIPVLDLARWLEKTVQTRGPAAGAIPVVVIRAAGRETALLVEEVIGERDLLIRSLGPRLATLRIFSGAAVLADGAIALVLNSAAIAEEATVHRLRPDLPSLQAEDPQPTPKRILVVDDSLTVRTLVKIILEAAGYQVLTAADGSEAWDVLRSNGADAVVADVDMPRMDGFTLTKTVRDSPDFKNLPIILVTARERAADKARGLELGADAYLSKSTFDQRQLLDVMRQVLSEPR